jgi:2-polyprenyl-6-methoxyphenol hydroxylase-like FAD-dependent oxidoreductase
MRPISIAIIGAGIGGLAAAVLLRRAGHDVQVYEQAARLTRIGAGIQMAPNAMKVLRSIGIEERLMRTAFRPELAVSREWDTGEVTSELPLGATAEREYGASYLLMHRGDLHMALADAVPSEVIHRGMKLVALDRNAGGVQVRFADGTRVHADAVIGTDGVHSAVREILLGPEKPRYTGKVAYRAVFPADRLRGARLAPARTKWWGHDQHMVIYYVTPTEVYFGSSMRESAEWMTPESWSSRGSLDALRAAYAGFHPEVQAVLQACPDEVYKWALFERDPLPTWSEGRVVLLGDACHPMTPYMAQGAASALEDAAILSRCLAGVGVDELEEAFSLYEAIRKPRASAIQAGSSANNWLRGKADPSWVYGYDACTVPLTVAVAA